MTDFEALTLDNIGGGVAPELFDHELKRVLENIDDPNTDPKKARKLVLTFTFEPDETRKSAAIKISPKVTLAPVIDVHTQMFMGRRDGQLVALDADPRQTSLFDDPSKNGGVIPMNREEANDG